MSDSGDPLIHGPDGTHSVSSPMGAGSSARAPLDLNRTNPAEDLFLLSFKPRAFFTALGETPYVGPWLLAKAIGALALASWLTAFVKAPNAAEGRSIMVDGLLNALTGASWALPFLNSDAPDMDFGAAAKGLKTMVLLYTQFEVLISPLLSLLNVLTLAGGVALLLPYLARDRGRLPFKHIFALFCFVMSFQILGLIPGVGGLLAVGFMFFYGIWALKWAQGMSALRAAAAIYLPYIFGAFFVLLCLVILAVPFALKFGS